MSVIAVWGKNGSGRSTIATNLAVFLAKQGNLVGLVGASKTYGSIQHYLGIDIPEEKSLKNALESINEDDIVKCFVQHSKVKDLFILSLSNSDNCLKLRSIKEDVGKRLFLNTKDKFDHFIIDCTENFTDTITMIGCQFADCILEIIKPTIQSAVFRKSQDELLESLKFKEKLISIANSNKDLITINDFERSSKLKFAQVLPYSKNVENSENTGEPISLLGAANRTDKEYLKGISQIADLINKNSKQTLEANKSNSKFKFIYKKRGES